MKKHNFTKHRTIRDFGGDSKNGDITVDKTINKISYLITKP